MDSVAIRVESVGKQYWKGIQARGRLIEWLRRKDKGEPFWALRGVSFEVPRGQMFGVVGQNGSGKSTLLKILARLTRPNEGRVEICGRLGALLELGTGFHPELTGRENLFLNGAMMGLGRVDILRRFDEIVAFSGLHDFLDTPIKRYSSGMMIRLAFSIAAHLDYDILLVDEVLAVGDAAFRAKSLKRMTEVIQSGRTVIFVGHNMSVLTSICERAIWLDHGILRAEGPASEITHQYLDATLDHEEHGGSRAASAAGGVPDDDEIEVSGVRLLDADGGEVAAFRAGQSGKVAIGYKVRSGQPLHDIAFGFTILSRSQNAVAVCQNTSPGEPFPTIPPDGEFVCSLPKLALMPGQYKLNIRYQVGHSKPRQQRNAAEIAVLEGEFYLKGSLPAAGSCDVLMDYHWSVETSNEIGDRGGRL